MTMQYRGIAYEAVDTSTTIESEIVEGMYHGLQTEIFLPQRNTQSETLKDAITYRGAKLGI